MDTQKQLWIAHPFIRTFIHSSLAFSRQDLPWEKRNNILTGFNNLRSAYKEMTILFSDFANKNNKNKNNYNHFIHCADVVKSYRMDFRAFNEITSTSQCSTVDRKFSWAKTTILKVCSILQLSFCNPYRYNDLPIHCTGYCSLFIVPSSTTLRSAEVQLRCRMEVAVQLKVILVFTFIALFCIAARNYFLFTICLTLDCAVERHFNEPEWLHKGVLSCFYFF